MRMGHAGRLTMAELLCGSMGRYGAGAPYTREAISDIATDIACSVGVAFEFWNRFWGCFVVGMRGNRRSEVPWAVWRGVYRTGA